jgi:outer membrane protein OmpA-like peptidoglycan-associated protein
MTARRLRITTLLVLAGALAASGCANVRERVTRDQIVAAPTCQDMTFPIYFETGSASLTPPAKQLIRDTAADAKRCTIREVLVVGLADADGSTNRNLQLSQQRAQRVAIELAAQGFPTATFETDAAGEAGAVTPTGAPEPLRRRAEVVVRLGPPTTTAAK